MMSRTRRIALVVGARSDALLVAPLLRALEPYPEIEVSWIQAAPGGDRRIPDELYRDLAMRGPDVDLGIDVGTGVLEMAQVLVKIEEYLLTERMAGRPVDLVVAVGESNAALASAMAAAKLEIPVAHVDAGLRGRGRASQDVNRLVLDAIAELLLCSEPAAVARLRGEGKPESKIRLVGNLRIDTLEQSRQRALERSKLADLGLLPGGYGFVTLHRGEEMEDSVHFEHLARRLSAISERIPLVFAIHPSTGEHLRRLAPALGQCGTRSAVLPPQGYLDFLCLASQARLIVTDSEDLQAESTVLGVPCLSLRTSTERPITVEMGTSVLVGHDLDVLEECVDAILEGEFARARGSQPWDGHAAERVVVEIASFLKAPIRNPMLKFRTAAA